MCQVTSSALKCGCQQVTAPVVACALNCGNITLNFVETPGECNLHFHPRRIGQSPALVEDRVDSDLYRFTDDLSHLNADARHHPRFLFRGYHGTTGAAGQAPRGFPLTSAPPPPVTDLTVDQIHRSAMDHVMPRRAAMEAHAQGRAMDHSPFTSWTADFATALWFAIGTYVGDKVHVPEGSTRARARTGAGEPDVRPWRLSADEGYVCLLDTWAWQPQAAARGRHVVRLGYWEPALPMEYLVYGHIVTPAWRRVPVAAIRRALGCATYPLCPHPARAAHRPGAVEVRDAVRVGRLFQTSPGAEDAVDSTLAVAAAALSRMQTEVSPPHPLDDDERAACRDRERALWRVDAPEELWPGPSFEAIRDQLLSDGVLPPLSGAPLANVYTDTTGAPQLKLVRNLLLPFQAHWNRLVAGGRGLPVGTRQEWEASVEASARQEVHVCPVIRRCATCGRAEGEQMPMTADPDWVDDVNVPRPVYFFVDDVVLSPCGLCGTNLYCSPRLCLMDVRGSRAQHLAQDWCHGEELSDSSSGFDGF